MSQGVVAYTCLTSSSARREWERLRRAQPLGCRFLLASAVSIDSVLMDGYRCIPLDSCWGTNLCVM